MSKEKAPKLYIIGIGPGGLEYLTLKAMKALEEAQVVIGYHRYLEQIAPLLERKRVISAQMTEEVKRAKEALSLAKEGHVVALVSGGDPGIYGMSAPVYEVLAANPELQKVKVETIAGVTAACAAAAKTGAPLSGDVVFLSLSDRLTPWSTIEKRLLAALEGDFVLVIYNPTSRKRRPLLEKALQIIAQKRPPSTPVGLGKNVTRPKEKILVFRLAEISSYLSEIDMATVLIVGNSQSEKFGSWIITPRGYGKKYRLHEEN